MDIPQKFRLTFRQANYFRSFTYGFGVVVRDLGEWRPGFYTEFRCASREHSGLPWGAIFRKVLVLTPNPRFTCSFFQEQVPKMDSSPNIAVRKEHGDIYKYIYKYIYICICIYIYICICICICIYICFGISRSTGP